MHAMRPTEDQLRRAREIAPSLGIVLPDHPDSFQLAEHERAIEQLGALVRVPQPTNYRAGRLLYTGIVSPHMATTKAITED